MVAEVGRGRKQRVGAVDVGSNSVKLLVADVAGGRLEEIERWGRVTRLARGLVRGQPVSQAALRATREVLAECIERARALGCDRLLAAATGGLRLTPEPRRLAAELAEGIVPLPVLTAGTEAYISLLGMRAGAGWPGAMVAADLGGSSTEVTLLGGDNITTRSLDIGAVTMTETYLVSDPPTADQLAALDEHLRKVLATLPDPPAGLLGPGRPLIAVGGTITALALLAIDHPPASGSVAHGECLEAIRLSNLTDHLAVISSRERQASLGIGEGRADILVAGARILLRVLERFRCEELRVSGWGLRHGLAIAVGIDPEMLLENGLDEDRARLLAMHTPELTE